MVVICEGNKDQKINYMNDGFPASRIWKQWDTPVVSLLLDRQWQFPTDSEIEMPNEIQIRTKKKKQKRNGYETYVMRIMYSNRDK